MRHENVLTLRISPIYFKSFNGSQFRFLRNILSELNCVVSLINEIYGISISAFTCWLLVGIIIVLLFTLFELEDGQYGSLVYLIVYFTLLTRTSPTCPTAASVNDTSLCWCRSYC